MTSASAQIVILSTERDKRWASLPEVTGPCIAVDSGMRRIEIVQVFPPAAVLVVYPGDGGGYVRRAAPRSWYRVAPDQSPVRRATEESPTHRAPIVPLHPR